MRRTLVAVLMALALVATAVGLAQSLAGRDPEGGAPSAATAPPVPRTESTTGDSFAEGARAGVDSSSGALVLPVAKASTKDVADPLSGAWSHIPTSEVHLSRTPPLHSTGATDEGQRPRALVSVARTEGDDFVRVSWADGTEDRGPTSARYPDAGDPRIYGAHSLGVETFADAVCVMVPDARGPCITYPSLMMGDAQTAVRLYYWRAGVGGSILGAHGRSTTGETEQPLKCSGKRAGEGWAVALPVGDLPEGTPLAFAIWDGSRGHRDGEKYFTPWYEVGP